ncbi:uncharacterized protein A4U43_C06F12040 [Asparagus officinalis]|uniref:Hyaluronan/mRNA-binding protein domain-containing protein n=1 Tax=Asparagus officinalis TaxID=4686 RepID=A0A5P1ELB6_ASPOF|nr:uncharacterized protein A4U43_C06F12040 [Asparagus officinalis]
MKRKFSYPAPTEHQNSTLTLLVFIYHHPHHLLASTSRSATQKKGEEGEKMEKNGKKGSKGHGKPDQNIRKDRRSATGMSGDPKKGGHGGKFTWAGDQSYADDGYMSKGALDAKDPNFEDEEVVEALQAQ